MMSIAAWIKVPPASTMRVVVRSQSSVAKYTFHQESIASGSGLGAIAATGRPPSRHIVYRPV